jgi:hypothetical protein
MVVKVVGCASMMIKVSSANCDALFWTFAILGVELLAVVRRLCNVSDTKMKSSGIMDPLVSIPTCDKNGLL